MANNKFLKSLNLQNYKKFRVYESMGHMSTTTSTNWNRIHHLASLLVQCSNSQLAHSSLTAMSPVMIVTVVFFLFLIIVHIGGLD